MMTQARTLRPSSPPWPLPTVRTVPSATASSRRTTLLLVVVSVRLHVSWTPVLSHRHDVPVSCKCTLSPRVCIRLEPRLRLRHLGQSLCPHQQIRFVSECAGNAVRSNISAHSSQIRLPEKSLGMRESIRDAVRLTPCPECRTPPFGKSAYQESLAEGELCLFRGKQLCMTHSQLLRL